MLGPAYSIHAHSFITKKQTTTLDNNATHIVKFAKDPHMTIEVIVWRDIQCCQLRMWEYEVWIDLRGGMRMKRELASFDIWCDLREMAQVTLIEIHVSLITIYSQIAKLVWRTAVHTDMVKTTIAKHVKNVLLNALRAILVAQIREPNVKSAISCIRTILNVLVHALMGLIQILIHKDERYAILDAQYVMGQAGINELRVLVKMTVLNTQTQIFVVPVHKGTGTDLPTIHEPPVIPNDMSVSLMVDAIRVLMAIITSQMLLKHALIIDLKTIMVMTMITHAGHEILSERHAMDLGWLIVLHVMMDFTMEQLMVYIASEIIHVMMMNILWELIGRTVLLTMIVRVGQIVTLPVNHDMSIEKIE